jgi:hypothetical protein
MDAADSPNQPFSRIDPAGFHIALADATGFTPG